MKGSSFSQERINIHKLFLPVPPPLSECDVFSWMLNGDEVGVSIIRNVNGEDVLIVSFPDYSNLKTHMLEEFCKQKKMTRNSGGNYRIMFKDFQDNDLIKILRGNFDGIYNLIISKDNCINYK